MREQNSTITMNRRETLRLSLVAALTGTSAIPGKIQAMQDIDMRAISLPELPPKPPEDVAAKLLPGFVRTEVRTSGATIPVFHKGDGPPLLLLHRSPLWVPTIVVLASPIACAWIFPRASRKVASWTSLRHWRCIDKPVRSFHWTRSSVLSGI